MLTAPQEAQGHHFDSGGEQATVEQAIIITNKMLKNIDKNTWAYDAGTEVVEGVTVNFEEDVDDDGDLKEDVVTQLWEVLIDNLEFTKDENGIMHVKGYVPKSPTGYRSQVWIYVKYNQPIKHSIGDIYKFTLESDIGGVPPYQYNLTEGEHFEYNMLGKLENTNMFKVTYQVLKTNDYSANVFFELDYINKEFEFMNNLNIVERDFMWEKIFKW